MKLSITQANGLFVLLVSVAMTAVMSFGILLMRLGWQPNFPLIWLGDFLLGCCLSIPTGFTVVPLIRRWVFGFVAPAESIEQAGDHHQAIDSLVGQYEQTLNAKDAAGFARLFHPDAVYNNVMGFVIAGRDALERWHQSLFDGSGRLQQRPDFSLATLTVESTQVMRLSAEVVMVEVGWHQAGAIDPKGELMPTRQGISVWNVTKEQGTWLIKTMNNKDVPDSR